ncbi:MAG: hypothetical protein EOO09_01715 [Chitinophagaceae bacterium]|nr:MAG: hypothetical protein EOO09_01715 [Chitinophagaceae bacterium]
MYAKIRSSNFIDALQLEFNELNGNSVRAVIRDDSGLICGQMENNRIREKEQFTWDGLNDLPYGRYTLTLFQGSEEFKLNLVKRV